MPAWESRVTADEIIDDVNANPSAAPCVFELHASHSQSNALQVTNEPTSHLPGDLTSRRAVFPSTFPGEVPSAS